MCGMAISFALFLYKGLNSFLRRADKELSEFSHAMQWKDELRKRQLADRCAEQERRRGEFVMNGLLTKDGSY